VRLTSRRASLAALAGYCLLSFLYFGLPVASHPGGSYIGNGSDPEIFIWSFAWWPHAMLHGQNPFHTHAIWAPEGYNLAWATSVPGLALAFAPLTLVAGPVVAYNAASVLLPALAAWTGFLLCRHVTRATWPSLVGGYLFGFSSYMLGQEQGHMHMTAVFLVPLVALVLLRYVQGELTGKALVVRLGALLALQLSFSTELFFTLTLALATALVICFLCVPARRARLRSLLVPLVGAYALGALLALPLIVYALTGFRTGTVNPPGSFVADVLNFVVPTGLIEVSGRYAARISKHFPGNSSEQGAYLGLPVLVMIAWYAWRRWKTPAGRFLVAALAVTVVAAIGKALYVEGHRIAPAPWALIADLPLFNNVITVRLSLYLTLIAAVVVAIWAASRDAPAWLRVLLPAVAVLALVPQLRSSPWKVTPTFPSFFAAGGAYRTCLRPGENVLILPYGHNGHSMLWQARTGFRFAMAGGYISADTPKSYTRYATAQYLVHGEAPPGGAEDLVGFAHAKGVSTILVEEPDAERWRGLLMDVARPRTVGGMLVYPLTPGPAASRACAAAG
jgi:hypothetical protein